jgi:hypothetical protein
VLETQIAVFLPTKQGAQMGWKKTLLATKQSAFQEYGTRQVKHGCAEKISPDAAKGCGQPITPINMTGTGSNNSVWGRLYESRPARQHCNRTTIEILFNFHNILQIRLNKF